MLSIPSRSCSSFATFQIWLSNSQSSAKRMEKYARMKAGRPITRHIRDLSEAHLFDSGEADDEACISGARVTLFRFRETISLRSGDIALQGYLRIAEAKLGSLGIFVSEAKTDHRNLWSVWTNALPTSQLRAKNATRRTITPKFIT